MSAALSSPPPPVADRAVALHRVLMRIADARVRFTMRRLTLAVARLERSRQAARYAYDRAQAALEDAARVAQEQPEFVWRCRCRLAPGLTIKPCELHT